MQAGGGGGVGTVLLHVYQDKGGVCFVKGGVMGPGVGLRLYLHGARLVVLAEIPRVRVRRLDSGYCRQLTRTVMISDCLYRRKQDMSMTAADVEWGRKEW